MAYRRAPADEFEIHEESNDAKIWRECCTDPCVSLWTYNPCIATFFIIALVLTVLVSILVIPQAQTASDNAHDLNDAVADSAYQSVGISVRFDPTLTWSTQPGAPCCNLFSQNLLSEYIARNQQSFCALNCPSSINGPTCAYTNITDQLIGIPVLPTQIILQQPIVACDGTLKESCNGQSNCATAFGFPIDVTSWALTDPSVSITPPCNQYTAILFAYAISGGIRSFANCTSNIPGNASICISAIPLTWNINTIAPIEIILEPMVYSCDGFLIGDVFMGFVNVLNLTGSITP